MSTKPPPTSPSAARRFTSPTPASPPALRAGSVKPTTPEKTKAGTPAAGSSPVAATVRSPTAEEPDSPTPEKTKVGTPAAGSSPVAATARSPSAREPEPPTSTGNKKAGKDEPDETIPDACETLVIDKSVFCQIIEMDDDPKDREFSHALVVDYFEQAATTLKELQQALEEDIPLASRLEKLKSKGHFLKGSSAALGAKKVQESCEYIQHYGARRDEINGIDLTEVQALRCIERVMPRLQRDYQKAEKWLEGFYAKPGTDLDTYVGPGED